MYLAMGTICKHDLRRLAHAREQLIDLGSFGPGEGILPSRKNQPATRGLFHSASPSIDCNICLR